MASEYMNVTYRFLSCYCKTPFRENGYRGSPPYAHFGTWKKSCYMKLVLVGLYCGPLLTLIPPLPHMYISRTLKNWNFKWFFTIAIHDEWWKNSIATKKFDRNIFTSFFTKSVKTGNGNICILCHNFWTNWDPISTSKWFSEPKFCERWTYIWLKNDQKWS